MLVRTKASNKSGNCRDGESICEYSYAQQLINNIPYITMVVLGAAIFAAGLASPVWAAMAVVLYVIYGLAAVFWLIVFLCPYCNYWDTRSCPCGYGRIAARLRRRKDSGYFDQKFKKHIPVIVPLWFIPVLVGGPILIGSFSWLLLVLLVVFCLDAFIVLPVFSARHGCKKCPQKGFCPWMSTKKVEDPDYF